MNYSPSPAKHCYLQFADDEKGTDSQILTSVTLAYINCHWRSKYKLKPGKIKELERSIFLYCLIVCRSKGNPKTEQRPW